MRSLRPWSPLVAAALLIGVVLCTVGSVVLGRLADDTGAGSITGSASITLAVQGMAFAAIGAVVIARRPENAIGWIFGAVGWFSASGQLADQYAIYGLTQASGLPFTVLAVWYSEWFWIPMLFAGISFALLVFPSGRLPSPRWRPVMAIITVGMILLVISAALDPALEASSGPSVPNPIGVPTLGDVDDDTMATALFIPLLLFAGLSGVASLIIRFRRSRGEERQQLKWVTYAATVALFGFILMGVIDAVLGFRVDALEVVVMLLVPAGAAIAIFRYRLYDIDLVVNRTIVYALLTAVLAGTYVGAVALLQTVLPVGGSDLAVAGSTLAVAALFNPARRRIQGFIDHHFYRRKYDAQRTIDDFAAQLRDEIDIDALGGELVQVATRTMNPTHASVWLRPVDHAPTRPDLRRNQEEFPPDRQVQVGQASRNDSETPRA